MSITITVRPNGAASGGTSQTIAGDGDIDTKEEAEAALSFLPEGSTDSAYVGAKSYTRAQLMDIRDGKSAPAADAAATVPGDGASHGFYLQGRVLGGLGRQGHTGGGVGLGYVLGVPLSTGETRVFLDPSLGGAFGYSSSSYTTPGGEKVSSGFTQYGGDVGVALRVAPNILDHRLFFGGGVSMPIGGFSTADSATVSTPQNCTPGDLGRADCEPTAGSRNGNAGTRGLMDFRTGSARGTSGVFLAPGLNLNVGYDIVRGDWGKIAGLGTFNVSRMILAPSDGDGFSYAQLGGFLGIRGDFGGSAVEKSPKPAAAATPAPVAVPPQPPKPDRDDDGVPDDVDACPDEKGVKSADPKKNGCPAFNVSWFVSPTYPAGARPAANDIVMAGQDKLEGISYYIEAFDSATNKLVATLDSKTEGHTLTLEKGKAGFVAFMSPEKDDKFKKQYNYFVTLMDKDGKPLTRRQGFTVAETVAAGRGRTVARKK